MEWDLDNGDAYEAEARELVATVEQVASMLRSAITGCLAHEFREWEPLNMDAIVRAITQSPIAEHALNVRTVFA